MLEANSPSAKRPVDPATEDAPSARMERTSSQVEKDLAEDDAACRDCPRTASHDNQPAVGNAPYVSTPTHIENASRNPVHCWSLFEVLRYMGNPV